MSKLTAGLSVSMSLVLGAICLAVYARIFANNSVEKNGRKPNIIIFLADDSSYADFHSFGNPVQEWGAIDRMAEEGMKFTQFTVGASVCSPSRAALLTGRYPIRSGTYGRPVRAFAPTGSGGLPKSEITLAESLRDLGYTTGMVGKWHLGINEYTATDGNHLPVHHGFDFVGTNMPFTNFWTCSDKSPLEMQTKFCFLYYNTTLVEQPVNKKNVTRKLVRETKMFINENRDNPFFFYFSHIQAKSAMFCDDEFCGKSRRGQLGDSLNEMAWSVGEILDELKVLGLEKDTLALFFSDNGNKDFNCRNEGSRGVFRGGSGSTWEGGFRVPAIAWWPGKIPPRSISHNLVNAMDILPTALYLAGEPDYMKVRNVIIDGQIIPEISGSEAAPSSRDTLIYYCSDKIMGVRHKDYKVHYHTMGKADSKMANPDQLKICEHDFPTLIEELDCYGPNSVAWDPPLVFNIMVDPEERLILNASLPEIKNLLKKVEDVVAKHEEYVTRVPSEITKNGGPSVQPCCNPPKCVCNNN